MLKKQENNPAFDFTQTWFLHDSAAFLCVLMEHISLQYLLFANMWFLVINLSFNISWQNSFNVYNLDIYWHIFFSLID